ASPSGGATPPRSTHPGRTGTPRAKAWRASPAAAAAGRPSATCCPSAARRRAAATPAAPGQDRNAEGEGLAGISLARGVSAAIRDRFAERPDDEPLVFRVLLLSPAALQE